MASPTSTNVLTVTSDVQSFGGRQLRLQHQSQSTGTSMHVSVYLPPQSGPRPVVWFLSGLTCTDQNVVTKSGLQRVASELGLIVICPDTSPRGADIAGEDDRWDFGSGASFYVNATSVPWATHYRMEQYLTEELPKLLISEFDIQNNAQSIMGHSMGGHGALILALRNPQRYRSVSALSPICAPSQVPWGQYAFSQYFKTKSEWQHHDATALLLAGHTCPEILIDQGESDEFLAGQLTPNILENACLTMGQPLTLRMQPGYDHSYFFVATFMADHLHFHANKLRSDR